MRAMALTQYDYLSQHMSEKRDKNMQRRQTRIVRGVLTLKFQNILVRESENTIRGHIFGPGIDFEYNLIREQTGGAFKLLRCASSRTDAMEILAKEGARILKRIETDKENTYPVKYKEGEFYLKRDSEGRKTPAMKEALSLGIYPETAAKNISDWKFIVIKGRKKTKKLQN